MITLRIKGTLEGASEAAAARSIPLHNARPVPGFQEIDADAPDHCWRECAAWFSEHDPREQPTPGALVMHNHTADDVSAEED